MLQSFRSTHLAHTFLRGAIVLGLALFPAAQLSAQAFPTKPVRIMVGAGAGGGTDILARMLAEKMGESMKQSFIVENRPGASNTIAADLTAKAAPDGHTLLVATNTGQAIAPHVLSLSFNPLKDLQPIGLIAVVNNVLIVGPAAGGVRDVKELLAAIKSKGGLRYASSGVGSTQHIAGEAFDLATNTKNTHVPYKGSSQAHVDLLGGQVEMMFDTTSSAAAHIKSGKLKPLAILSAKRSGEFTDVPTLTEAGVSGVDVSTWYALYVTGSAPKAAVDALAAELQRVLRLPDVQAKIKGLGGDVGTLGPAEMVGFGQSEFDRYGVLIKTANIKLN
jgi:tripartite-type tricarboxylate transporter receptor subunit TctC